MASEKSDTHKQEGEAPYLFISNKAYVSGRELTRSYSSDQERGYGSAAYFPSWRTN